MSLSNPSVLEKFMRENGIAGIEVLIDALDRMVTAVDGGAAAGGVVVTPIGGGSRAVTDTDFTGDGNRESTVTAEITGESETLDLPSRSSRTVRVGGACG